MAMRRAVPAGLAPPLVGPCSELSGAHALFLLPLLLPPLFLPPAQLPGAICGTVSAPVRLGITRLGQGFSQGNRIFSVPVGGCVKHGLFYLPLDLTFLV